jgi:outer membrane protein assembly factor BamB
MSRQSAARRALPIVLMVAALAVGPSASAGSHRPGSVQVRCANKNPNDTDIAEAFQQGPHHGGAVDTAPLVPPLVEKWHKDFNGPVSYPVIAQGKIFVTVANPATGNPGTKLIAYDNVTGATVWSAPIPSSEFWSNATYDKGCIYVVDSDGDVQAINADSGNNQWKVHLQVPVSSPPIAKQFQVYIGTGDGVSGTVYDIREVNGDIDWSMPVDSGEHSAPALSHGFVFVNYGCGETYEFDYHAPIQYWKATPYSSCTDLSGGRTPAFADKKVYVRDAHGSAGYILNQAGGTTAGTFSAGGSALALNRGFIYQTVAGGLQKVNGLGVVKWTFTAGGADTQIDSPPIVANSATVFVGSASGMVYGVNASTGSGVWSASVGVPIVPSDEDSVDQPLTGLNAGEGILVVPSADSVNGIYRLTVFGPP